MKDKSKIIIIVVIAILLILLVAANSTNKKKTKEEEQKKVEDILTKAENDSKSISDNEKRQFTNIDIDKFIEDYQSSEYNIVLIASPTCHYCELAEPILQNIAYVNDLNIEYLDISTLNDEENSRLNNCDEFFKGGVGTPLLLILGDNSIINKVDGLVDRSTYMDFFIKTNIIR